MAQHNLLVKADPKDWDIIALQEPYLDHLHLMYANQYWNVIYPSNKSLDRQAQAQSVLLINTNIHSEQVNQIAIHSGNITAVQIETDWQPLIIINIYNDNTHNQSIDTINNEWDNHENSWLSDPNTKLLVLGDFNWHHSTWENHNNTHLTSQD